MKVEEEEDEEEGDEQTEGEKEEVKADLGLMEECVPR